MSDDAWTPTARERPPRDAKVDWITSTGQVVRGGTYAGGLIWLLPTPSTMHVYYTPQFWRLHHERKATP